MALEQASIPEAFVDELLDRFLGIAGALLNPPHQFVFTAFLVAEVVLGQFCVLLFEFAFDDIPIALDVECVHFDIPFSVLLMFICFWPRPSRPPPGTAPDSASIILRYYRLAGMLSQ
jgi:hypothetical protein